MEERDNNQNASMVFTLQDEHNALPDAHEQDTWETAPHDWREPESPAEYGTADPAAYAPQAAAPVSAADDIPEPPPQSEAQEAPFRPAADESAAVHGTQAEENEQSADEQFADKVAAAALDALNQAENDSQETAQETADEASSEPAIIRDPAAVPDYRLPDPPPADNEPAPEREKPLAERAAELPAGSLAARIAGLHAPEALADHSDNALPEPAPAKPARETTPEEREYGRLRYLQHLADEHNRNLFDDSGEQKCHFDSRRLACRSKRPRIRTKQRVFTARAYPYPEKPRNARCPRNHRACVQPARTAHRQARENPVGRSPD